MSRRNRSSPIKYWTWSKVVRSISLEAGLEGFSTHTLRHLCLTELARSGWDIHEIATFAGHRHTDTTLIYIHLSGEELGKKYSKSIAQLHEEYLSVLGDKKEVEI